MYKFIENITELNEILETMDNFEINQRIYYAGHTLVLINIDENGKESEYKTDMAYFVVSDDEDSEENIGKAFFNLMINKECKAGTFINFDVNIVDETMEIFTSETSVKYLFDFWNSAPMTKEMIDWALKDLAG